MFNDELLITVEDAENLYITPLLPTAHPEFEFGNVMAYKDELSGDGNRV